MPSRNYSSTANVRSLVGGIAAAATVMRVDNDAAGHGWPTLPFIAVIERGSAKEELVLVTGGVQVAGTTHADWTITRAFDQPAARAVDHATGMKVEHVTAAIDFREAQSRLDALEAIDMPVLTDSTTASSTSAPSTWPAGISRRYVTETGSWPAAWGQVETIKAGGDVIQRYTAFVTGRAFWRTAQAATDAWKPWNEVAELKSTGGAGLMGTV